MAVTPLKAAQPPADDTTLPGVKPPFTHFQEWWAETKAAMPAFHHRSPIEFIEEQIHRLEARLK